ncbi:MAG: diphthine--ammonia ligase [Nanoarchaeota archaeon]
MDVAILYSGGKDSTYAIEYCQNKNWNIKYLISVKPSRTDCYLYHYATVELTKELSNILGYKQFYLTCDVADPEKEALIVKNLVEKNKVDALVLGGVGLQETQLRSLQKALLPLKIEVFASHSGEDHEILFRDMINKGYKIIITQVATDGGKKWLGREINKENFEEFKKDSIKYGFHIGLEGGYMDSLVVDAPFFNKKLEILNAEKIFESEYNGYVNVNNFKLVEKTQQIIKN